MTQLTFRQATLADAEAVADLLVRILPACLPARLGHDFAAQFFLPMLMAHSKDTPIHLGLIDGKPVAFAVYSIPQSCITRLSKKILPKILWAALKKSLRDPGVLLELAYSGFSNPVETATPKAVLDAANYLVYLGTDSTYRGQGIATQLIRYGLQSDLLSGARCLVETDNPKTVAFYQALDFSTIGIRKRYGANMTLLLKENDA